MKQILEPIEVREELTPRWRFRWRQRVYRVIQVSQRWFYRGKWWLDPKLEGETRKYFRVVCCPLQPTLPTEAGPYSMPRRRAPQGVSESGNERVMELFCRCRPEGTDWVLSKVVD